MSEYQYYQFKIIDQVLNQQQQTQLRDLSPQAKISANDLVHLCDYGEVAVSPVQLMTDYFDAHVYTASWGGAVLMLKIAKSALPLSQLQRFANNDGLTYYDSDNNWIIEWRLMANSLEPDSSLEADSSLEPSNSLEPRKSLEPSANSPELDEQWMKDLLPIRAEIIKGDLRSLYIGWVSALYLAQDGEETDDDADEEEPMRLTGLNQLTVAQQALVRFIQANPLMLTAASINQPEGNPRTAKDIAKNL
ncbi:MAG: hypothetical protein ACI8WB_003373 [Phenylobacterium sp.]|jgi:hypothetical protein